MVDKAKNIGTRPIDGNNNDIYSFIESWNVFSLMKKKEKYDKNRPPPTYIDYTVYEELIKRSAHHPLSGLKICEDMNRIECVNDKTIKDNKGLKTYLMKQLAKNIFKGSASVSLPAYAFDPVSNVSAFMNNFRTAPYFLNKAIHVSPKTDPEERIRLITAMWVSSLHQNISFKRAFNPILGETYEGYFWFKNPEVLEEAPDLFERQQTSRLQIIRAQNMKAHSQPTNLKTKFINIFVEQTSHHPPISNFQIEHSDKDYVIHGNLEEVFQRNGSSIEFRTKGDTIIEFSDGDYYSIVWPAKIFENYVYMKYEEFIRVEQLNGSNLTSMVFLGDAQEGENFATNGVIYKRDPNYDFNEMATWESELGDIEETWWHIQGSWVKSLIIDDKKYWNIKQDVISPHLPVSNPLSSDSRYREDLIWVWKKSLDYAQKWKLALENIQRKDVVLRKKKKK